jgi:hypothetical protein
MTMAQPLTQPALHYQPMAGLIKNKYHSICSTCVVDPVIQCLCTPQWVRVIKLEKINTLSWIYMTTSINFLLAVPPIHWYDGGEWRTTGHACHLYACHPIALFNILTQHFCNTTNLHRGPTKQFCNATNWWSLYKRAPSWAITDLKLYVSFKCNFYALNNNVISWSSQHACTNCGRINNRLITSATKFNQKLTISTRYKSM